jgi:hypothetical protein
VTLPDLACVVSASKAEARRSLGAYADATMADTVLIERIGSPGKLNRATGLVSEGKTTVYTGPAWLGQVGGGTPAVVGEEMTFYDQVQVKLPTSAAKVEIDDQLTSLTSAATNLPGRSFRVVSVTINGLLPDQQVLVCSGVAPSRTNP